MFRTPLSVSNSPQNVPNMNFLNQIYKVCLVSSLLLSLASALQEELRIERSGKDGTFQRVSSTTTTYVEYSLSYSLPFESNTQPQASSLEILIQAQEGHSGYDTPLPFGSSLLLAIKHAAKDSKPWTLESTNRICSALGQLFAADMNIWMEACSVSIAASAPVSSAVLPHLPMVNISSTTSFDSAMLGQTDASLVRLRDWAFLGVRIPPSAFFHPVSLRDAVSSTLFEKAAASKIVVERRSSWNVPDVQIDSPLLRSWKISIHSGSISVNYVEHAHLRAVGSEWLVTRPKDQTQSTLVEATSHKNLPSDASTHISVRASCAERRLVGAGAHRTLETTIHLQASRSLSACNIIVAELLDQGIYIDRFEVDEAFRMGSNPSRVSFFTDIDLEKPAYESTQNFIFMHTKADTNNSVSVKLPVHFRYQAPSWSRTHEPVHVVAPEIYVKCESDANWIHVTHWGESSHDICEAPTAYIPVGDGSMERHITWVTLFATGLGALALVLYVSDCCAVSEDAAEAQKKKKDD